MIFVHPCPYSLESRHACNVRVQVHTGVSAGDEDVDLDETHQQLGENE